MKIRAFLTMASLTIMSAAPAVMAQTGGASQTTSSTAAINKIAVLDIQAAIMNTAEGKQAAAEVQSSFAARQAELDGIQKQVEEIGKKLQAGTNTLNDEEKNRLSRQGDLLQHQWQSKKDQYTYEANAASNEILERIGRKVEDVVARYCTENKIDLVVDSSGQTNPVLYRSPQSDITTEIVKLYDQQFPVKAGAATPAPKPTTPPATNPPAKKPGGTNPQK